MSAAQEIAGILAELRARADAPAQRARLQRLGAAGVPHLLAHLEGEFRDLALYGLQFCWTDDAAEPVARLLTDPSLEIRRMAAILLDRHYGREYVARRCGEHIGHPNAEVAGWCFEQNELMFPDLERARSLFPRAELHWRLARRLGRYYERSLAPHTRGLLADANPAVVRGAIVALIHHDDDDPATRSAIHAHLGGPHAVLREAAAEYLAWRGGPADLNGLENAIAQETDRFARASMEDAISAIERRSNASVTSGADVSSPAEAFEPRWFYRGADPPEDFMAARRAREERLARALAAPWHASLDAEEASQAAPPSLGTSLIQPTRDAFAAEGESFGVHTGADDLAFKSLVHVGADLSWQQDHAGVFAIADGVVRAVRCQPSWGYLVIVEHEIERALAPGLEDYAAPFAATIEEPVVSARSGIVLCSLYAHLGPFVRVRPGDAVRAGQKIGAIGRTFTWENGGYPAHLHFGVHLGPFLQSPLPGAALDINYRGRRYRGRALRTHAGGVDATISYEGDPAYPVTRTRRWECGYIARWYWDSGAHGWVSPRALLRDV